MRPTSVSQPLPAPPESPADLKAGRSDWATLSRLLPYLWRYKWRVVFALGFMVAAKMANVSVPLLLKELVDAMSIKPGSVESMLVVPLGLLLAYGGLRLSTSVFTELRELVFAKATEGATRSIALEVFGHLHALSLRFHLERQTGGLSRIVERGTKSIDSLLSTSLFNVLPTLLEILLVTGILWKLFDFRFAAVTFGTVALYITYTITVTNWRTRIRRQMLDADTSANAKAKHLKLDSNSSWKSLLCD